MTHEDSDDSSSVEVIDFEESFDEDSADEFFSVSDFESVPENEIEANTSNDDTSFAESENCDEESEEESDGFEINESSGEDSSLMLVDEESDEESEDLDEESDKSDEESMDESDKDTDRYGEEVETV